MQSINTFDRCSASEYINNTLGKSYEVVKAVYCNLDLLKETLQNVPDLMANRELFNKIVSLQDEIVKLAPHVDELLLVPETTKEYVKEIEQLKKDIAYEKTQAMFSFRFFPQNITENGVGKVDQLLPQLNIKVGDLVLNPLGDVYSIDHISDGIFSVGPALTSLIGPQGVQGYQGERGLQGIQGVQGPQGEQGPRGLQGPEGPVGIRGPEGPRGIQGERGIQGPQGLKGDPGTGLTIRGEYESLDALRQDIPVGNPGDCYLIAGEIWYWSTKIGSWASAGKLSGPQGPQGIIGPEGPEGPKGSEGPMGPKGPQGPIGPIGVQGPQGNPGPVGPQGVRGPAGPGILDQLMVPDPTDNFTQYYE